MAQFKRDADVAKVRRLLPLLLKYPGYRKVFWPFPLPKSYGQLGAGGIPLITTFAREFVWSIQCILPYADTISSFLSYKSRYESHLLKGDVDSITSVLAEIEQKFGVSVWLVEARINFLQTFRGYDEQVKFADNLAIQSGTHPLIRFLVSWISSRASQRIAPGEFYKLLHEVVPIDNGFTALTHVILGQHQLPGERVAAAALAYGDIFPVVDRYLLSISIVQAALTSFDFDDEAKAILSDELFGLFSRAPSADTARLLAFLGDDRAAEYLSFPLLDLQDLYTRGDYALALDKARVIQGGEFSIEALSIQLSSSLEAATEVDQYRALPDTSPIKNIAIDLARLIAFDQEADEAATRLSKIALTSSNCAWSSSLSLILERYYLDDRLINRSTKSLFHALRSQHNLPSMIFTHHQGPPGGYIEAIKRHPNSQTCALVLATIDQASWNDSVLDNVPADRVRKWQAISQIRKGSPQESVKILMPVYERRTSGPRWQDIGRILARGLLDAGDLHRCCDVSVQLFDSTRCFAQLLPLRGLLSNLVAASEALEEPNPSFFGVLTVVLAFDIYSRYVSPEYDEYKADAFKDFLSAHELRYASDLVNIADRFPRNQLVQFLEYVCVPEVLDQSLALVSTRAVEDERVKILVLLSELTSAEGKPPSSVHLEELSAIKTRQVVRDTTLRLDQSKVYVNVDGMRKTLGAMRETWRRYQLLTLQQRSSNLEELQKMLETALGERIAVLSLTLPLTESNKLFARMVFEVRDMFSLSKEFGLDANLSTNIRHGFVMREIRGPLLAHHLVTNKDSAAGSYQANAYWLDRMEGVPQYVMDEIANALAKFSEDVDSQIEYLNRNIIRIRSDQAKEGAFDFTIDGVSIQILQRRFERTAEFDDFYDEVIAALWTLTNRGLDTIREMLFSRTLTSLLASLQALQDVLHRRGHYEEVSGLLSATNLVRPDLRSAIERVASWFAIPSNNEYQDYDLRISYEAGLATIKSYYSHLSIQSEYLADEPVVMAGWTLPSLVRLFSLLLDNSAFHSGLAGGSLRIGVAAKLSSSLLELQIRNNLGEDVDLDNVRAKAASINAEFGRERASQLIPVEGGSGYPKIWKILAHDLGGNHALQVSVSESREFIVDIVLEAKGLVL
ncbi:hypothetical protein BSR47_01800 [Bradyrhizobium canariense]|nr:hypothetical protein BSR47_01800 [Bradyrhizobium canariense]